MFGGGCILSVIIGALLATFLSLLRVWCSGIEWVSQVGLNIYTYIFMLCRSVINFALTEVQMPCRGLTHSALFSWRATMVYTWTWNKHDHFHLITMSCPNKDFAVWILEILILGKTLQVETWHTYSWRNSVLCIFNQPLVWQFMKDWLEDRQNCSLSPLCACTYGVTLMPCLLGHEINSLFTLKNY